jgi:hypothetical protein
MNLWQKFRAYFFGTQYVLARHNDGFQVATAKKIGDRWYIETVSGTLYVLTNKSCIRHFSSDASLSHDYTTMNMSRQWWAPITQDLMPLIIMLDE